jgi:hypothetical protein
MQRLWILIVLGSLALPTLSRPSPAAEPKALRPRNAQHVVVYAEAGKFCGWPANGGAWNWGNEILVGFFNGTYEFKESEHSVTGAQITQLARSTDGGLTWQLDPPTPFDSTRRVYNQYLAGNCTVIQVDCTTQNPMFGNFAPSPQGLAWITNSSLAHAAGDGSELNGGGYKIHLTTNAQCDWSLYH